MEVLSTRRSAKYQIFDFWVQLLVANRTIAVDFLAVLLQAVLEVVRTATEQILMNAKLSTTV